MMRPASRQAPQALTAGGLGRQLGEGNIELRLTAPSPRRIIAVDEPTAENAPLERAFDRAAHPIYLVDADQTIVYANAALADWVGLERDEVIGGQVEYHSDSSARGGLLVGLCPSPAAFDGERGAGAVSCVDRTGRVRRRDAEFVPAPSPQGEEACPVLVIVAGRDLGPNEPAAHTRSSAAADRLHAELQKFRRARDQEPLGPLLIGQSPQAAKLRRQVEAAAATGANVLVRGVPGSGRAELAASIFRRSASGEQATLVRIDAALLEPEQIDHRIATAQRTENLPVVVLLENADAMDAATQSRVFGALEALLMSHEGSRVLSTVDAAAAPLVEPLLSLVSTLALDSPPLVDRLEDLPLLVQWFVEQGNAAAERQLVGASEEALERLALYSWPGGIPELEQVIAAARAKASNRRIEASDLPLVVQQATTAASLPSRDREAIDLDDFLAQIERELVERALAASAGNKAEAARLLGLTRPRLYRRLERLGVLAAGEAADETTEDATEDDAP